jgi:hypothetical protein
MAKPRDEEMVRVRRRRIMLIEFLLGLVADPTRHAAYKQDPLTTIARSSLNEEEKAALKNGDLPKLTTLITKVATKADPKGSRTRIERHSRPVIFQSGAARKSQNSTKGKTKTQK